MSSQRHVGFGSPFTPQRQELTLSRRWHNTTTLPLVLGLSLAAIQCGESSKDHQPAEGGQAGASAGETGGSSANGAAGSTATESGGKAAGGESATGGRIATGGSHANTGGAATGGRGGSGGSVTTGGNGVGGRSTGGRTGRGGTGGQLGTGGELSAGGSAGQASTGATGGVSRGGSAGQGPVGGTGGEVSDGGAGGEGPAGGSGGASSGGTTGTGGNSDGGAAGASGAETIESCFAGLRELQGSWQISVRENASEQIRLRLALETDDRMGIAMPWAAVRLALQIDGVVICLEEDALVDAYAVTRHNCNDVLTFEYGGMTYRVEGPDVSDPPRSATITVLSGETVVRGPIPLSTPECAREIPGAGCISAAAC